MLDVPGSVCAFSEGRMRDEGPKLRALRGSHLHKMQDVVLFIEGEVYKGDSEGQRPKLPHK